jgi:hypothetical protein
MIGTIVYTLDDEMSLCRFLKDLEEARRIAKSSTNVV